jgi:dTDP-4-dehydrorhamnose reductase
MKNLEELKNTEICDYFSEISDPSRNILILGASGLIGGSLYREFSCYNGFNITGTYNFNRFPEDLLQLDLENTIETIDLIKDLTPDVLIWAAENQYSKENPNVRNTFMEIIKNIPSKTKFVFFSSDTVFSGKQGNYSESNEIDIPSNNNYLHESILVKIERERFVRTLPDSIIIRTGPVYGKYLSGQWDFRTQTILSDIEHGSFTTISENTVRSFINCRFLAKSVLRLVEKDFRGIIHITNSTRRSTFEHYRILAEYNG